MHRLRFSLLLLITTLAAGASAQEKVQPGEWPKVADPRLTAVRHVDDPVSFKPGFKDKSDWEERAKELQIQVLIANGLWPMPEKTPLNPVVHGKIDRDDYTVEKVFFASAPGHYVCGNLYRPKGKTGKLPAVLSPHGHWANGRFYECGDAEAKRQMDSGAEKTMEGARYPLQARCTMLARLGCVVFHYDMVGYADSKQIPHRAGFADAEAELRLQSPMGLQTWNSIRALDFLADLPDVDPKRIAATGASGGGTQTFILCAIDDRPAVSFPAVMVSTAMQGGCICENCSYLRLGANNIELAALFAPKPQGMTGANDWTKEIETRGLPELQAIYKLYDAENKVMAKHFSFPHNYNQVSRELMYNWLNQHLQLGHKEPITEKPFVPVPPKELSVFHDKHPLPKEATDAAGLRKWLTTTSDKQMADLAKNPEEYQRVVGAALRIMIQDTVPRKDTEPWSLKASRTEYDTAAGFSKSRQVLVHKASGEELRTTTLTPMAEWNETAVIWVHPKGAASLFDADGKLVPAVKQLLDRKTAVWCADLFLTGEYHSGDKPTPAPSLPQKYHKDIPFGGYFYGYNRSLFANRVHDLLSLIAIFQDSKKVKAVDLIAFERAGPWALLARASSGGVVRKAAIDLNAFDFDQVKDLYDEMMLPGALKYGGVLGFAPLCTSGETRLYDPPKGGPKELLDKTKGLALQPGKAKAEEMVEWLLK